ncbi:hypothetical protein C8J30_101431 [Rhodobacter viridis]|uniref:Response regulatory domain-containing protein n=1 Tax=Rhodobacter viridis TaxID=1054202 RepID=A0A318U647_9RHOB|nr:hypothetical protein [Rhodobacter viridis]PYF13046.1 hypothetical protein C8J30_101431 [Rhodobacter viridis]
MPPPIDAPKGSKRLETAGLSLTGRRILVVDPSQSLPRALRGVQGANVTIARLSMIDAELMARIAPDVVLSPLFSPGHDILDFARLLDRLGYKGPLRAYSPPLPNTSIVCAEVRQIWGPRDFDILEVPPAWN